MSFFDFPEFHKNLRMIIELWRNHLDQIRNYHFLGSLYTNSTCSKHVIHAIWQVTTMPIMRFHDLKIEIRAFTAVELKSYNAILAPLIYQKHLAAVVVKQKFFADLLQCTSIDRCAL